MKTIVCSICLMLVLTVITPIAVEQTDTLGAAQSPMPTTPQMIGVVFGLFPHVSDDDITYLSVPGFQRVTILKDEFSGYVGIVIIYGHLDGSF